jgi:hypothetical protein
MRPDRRRKLQRMGVAAERSAAEGRPVAMDELLGG